MNWNLEGLRVSAKYLDDYTITGKVRLSRVKFGGEVSHHIDLDTPTEIYGNIRESVVINHADIERVYSN